MKSIALTFLMVSSLTWAVVVDGFAAEIGGKLLPIKTVQLRSALRSVLVGTRPRWLEKDALQTGLEETVRDEVLLKDSASFVQAEGKSFEQQAEKKIREIKSKQSDDWQWVLREFQISEGEATRNVSQILLADKILDRKAQTFLMSQPAEEKAGLDKNAVEAGVSKLAQGLRTSKVEKGLSQWIAALKETYRVKIFWERLPH